MALGIGSPPSCTTYPVILVSVSDTLSKTWWDILIRHGKKSSSFLFLSWLKIQMLIISDIHLTFQSSFEMSSLHTFKGAISIMAIRKTLVNECPVVLWSHIFPPTAPHSTLNDQRRNNKGDKRSFTCENIFSCK